MTVAVFEDLVLAWLQKRYASTAVSVIQVSADGSDWEGSTDAGFHSSFAVNIEYARQDGSTGRASVAGEDAASLWDAVVAPLKEGGPQ